jgi:hypothetical protein
MFLLQKFVHFEINYDFRLLNPVSNENSDLSTFNK